MPDKTLSDEVIVMVARAVVPGRDIVTADVNREIDRPSMAVITLRNHHHVYSSKYKLGDALEVKEHGETVFRGDVAGIEPIYRANGASTVVLRGFDTHDRLNRRGRKRLAHHGPGYFLKIDGLHIDPLDSKSK